jgi:L-ascorbate metabolism protein UlaG (beta-lactamase superfamily)
VGVTIEFLGHAGFLLGDGKHRVVIDPFLTRRCSG